MIVDSLITFIFNFVMDILAPLDSLNGVVIDPYIQNSIYSFFGFVAYLLPLRRLLPIFLIFVGIHMWRIVITLVKTIWDALPIV